MKRKCACVTEFHLWMCRLTCCYGMLQSKLQTQVKTNKDRVTFLTFPSERQHLDFEMVRELQGTI